MIDDSLVDDSFTVMNASLNSFGHRLATGKFKKEILI